MSSPILSSMLTGLLILTLSLPTQASAQKVTLSFEQTALLVLKGNSLFSSKAMEIAGAKALHSNAGVLQNPNISLELEDFFRSDAAPNASGEEITLRMNQVIELGGKRPARRELAHKRLLTKQAELENLRIEILRETALHFMHVVADQHRLLTAERAKTLAEQGFKFSSQRTRSGAASTIEKRRAGIALARSEINLEHREHELRASKRRLSMLWGSSDINYSVAGGELFHPIDIPLYETLAQKIEDNPKLIHFSKRQSAEKAKVHLAQAALTPDLSLNIGTRYYKTPQAYGMVFGISTPIPVFDRNRGEIESLEMRVQEIVAQQDHERIKLLAILYGHVQEFAHAKQSLHILQEEILPEADSVLKFITNGFRVGRFSQLELLDAQATLVELENERISAAEEMWMHAFHIQSLIGVNPFAAATDREKDGAAQKTSPGVSHE